MPEFIDARGLTVFYDVHPAEGDPRAVVQLCHGYGEHAGRYGALIASLNAAGFSVYADDHRGHGRTGLRQHGDDASRLGKLGTGGVAAAAAALARFTEIIRAENPGLPLVLLGHSWGSFMAQMILNRRPDWYDVVVLSGTVYRQLGFGNLGDLNARWKDPAATGLEWLCTDPEVVQAFIDDPLTTVVPIGKSFGLFGQLRMLGKPRRDLRKVGGDIPILLMVGRDDPVGGPRSVHKLAHSFRTRSGLTDVTTYVYPGARHEIFNEPGQAEVRADLLAWLESRVPARV